MKKGADKIEEEKSRRRRERRKLKKKTMVEEEKILEVGGAVQPGNRFVSFVRASGRGEAKLCGRARGDSIVKLGLL